MLYLFKNVNDISSENTVSTVQVDIVLEIKWLFIINEMRVQMSKNNQYRKFSLLHYVNDCFSYMLKVWGKILIIAFSIFSYQNKN